MHDLMCMSTTQCFKNLTRYIDCQLWLYRFLLTQYCLHRAAVNVLHHKVGRLAVRCVDHSFGQYVWDVRMLKTGEQLRFSNEALMHGGFGAHKRAVEEFRRNAPVQAALLGYVYAAA